MTNRKYCPFHQFNSMEGWYLCDGDSCELWTSHTSYTFNVHEDGSISEDATVTGGCALRVVFENMVKVVNWEGMK